MDKSFYIVNRCEKLYELLWFLPLELCQGEQHKHLLDITFMYSILFLPVYCMVLKLLYL